MITKQELANIAAYNSRGLLTIHHDLIMERMKMDKEMSDFLHTNEQPMSYEMDNYSDIWKEYKQMGAMYSELAQLITLTEFYMKRYGLL